MKGTRRTIFILCVLALAGTAAAGRPEGVSPHPAAPEREYYAIEIDGTLCGYLEGTTTPFQQDGRALRKEEAVVTLKLSILGAGVDMTIRSVAHVDPAKEQIVFAGLDMLQGTTRMGFTAVITPPTARWTPTAGGSPKELQVPEDVILGSLGPHPYLYRDFVQKNLDRAEYAVLDLLRGEVQKSVVTRKSREKIEMAGAAFDTVVLEEVNQGTGLKTTQWLDAKRDRVLRITFLNRVIYRTDAAVKDRIQRADLNGTMFAKVNVAINDPLSLTYLKVRAVLDTAGEWVTAESLNVPGQKFEGTVKDNRVEGVFEITRAPYDGRDAPPFPPDVRSDPALARYLAPEKLIESEDPALVAKARELTAGAKDAWEAARRLTRWVADEIGYDIPGGASAKGTFTVRAGECGAHSRLLTALCRGAGIPARMVVGCMYTRLNGGSFGQHAWTEIHMGRAGWVSVDSTAHEIDGVDAGHIRLGQDATFMPKKMEILDHRCAAAAGPAGPAGPEAVPDRYGPYLGPYSDETEAAERAVFRVLYRNGGLALDIPARMVCELKEPSPEGIWFLKLTDRVGVRFERDAAGNVSGLRIFEIATLPRKAEAAVDPSGAPETYRPYVGDYKVPMGEAVVRVTASGDGLSLDIPRRGKVALADPDDRGRWHDRRGNGDHYAFVKDDSGTVSALVAFRGETIPRGTCAAHLVEITLRDAGIDKALERYRELKAAPPADCRFSEQSFNLLGYRLLGQGKTAAALAIFRLNAEAYPASANVYDSLGEAYLKAGDPAKARENYEKSLQLDPKNTNARKALDSLGQ